MTAQLFTRTSSAPSSTWSAVAAHWSAVACAFLAIGVLSTFGEGRRLSTLDLAHNCHQGLPFPHPDGNRCSLRETARRRTCVHYATTIPSLAGRSQGGITSRSRSLPTDRIAIGFYEQSRSAPGVQRFCIPRRSVR